MKSQDILLLLKLVSLEIREKEIIQPRGDDYNDSWDWQDWEDEVDILEPRKSVEDFLSIDYTVRALSQSAGISKSEVSLSLRRCYQVGLAKVDRESAVPRTNTKALFEFIVYGLKYVFPAALGKITRGIATTLGAPVLQGKLMTSGELVLVWPDVHGKNKGQTLEPLYKTVTKAVRRDAHLYAMLALTDAVRIGAPREYKIAVSELKKYFRKINESL